MTPSNCVFPTAIMNGAGPEYCADQMENRIPRKAHRATILPAWQFKRFRTHTNRFGTGVGVVWGIKPKSQKGPRGGRVYVHAITFDMKRFSSPEARRWLKAHNYKPIRFQQAQPKKKAKAAPRKRAANAILPEGVVFHYAAAAANPVKGPKTIDEAIKLVQKHAPSPYARAYANASMQAAVEYGMHGLAMQVPYILSNLRTWKGDLARETKKFMKAWYEAHYKMNPAEPALKLPPKVKVKAKHRGITGLPSGAWNKWSEMQLANHFLALVPTYGPMMVNNWIKNIERWNKNRSPKLSAKARRVRLLVQKSPRYTKYKGRKRGSFRQPANPAEIAALCGVPAKNPSLMILLNPTSTAEQREIALANKAYKSFHFKDHTKEEKHGVPDSWPHLPYWIMGVVDRFDVKLASGKTVSRTFQKNKPILASNKNRKDCFIIRKSGCLGIPSGTGVRIDYTVPPKSGRTKWSRRWWHPHESSPKVIAHNGARGRHVRVTGPGLSINPRGIIG